MEEAELHRSWLGDHIDVVAGPVTLAYTDFLLARALGDDYVVGTAAVLPCFWLYAHLGAKVPHVPDDHPYASWLQTYGDPEFVEGASHTIGLVEKASRTPPPSPGSRCPRLPDGLPSRIGVLRPSFAGLTNSSAQRFT
ncbi:phosphomethylpyrimidine kinase [Cutibacterium acnes JCM 18918]|nr:phosphomethylpyrimidine kinase [Cutibacterium acnes JCM 18918]